MIDDLVEDFDPDGWVELILGLERACARAEAIFAAEAPGLPGTGAEPPGPVDDALLDAVLGAYALARRMRAALDACAADPEPEMPPTSPPPLDGSLLR